ncbi:MAG: Crp/Fnr family transcriptional regulator [Syntrophomonadaceae bacterium]|nr:Crp/Fnr family transcriptional regulator [Syntrophomonadaceae bacterium]
MNCNDSLDDKYLLLTSPLINIDIPDCELIIKYGEKKLFQKKEIIVACGEVLKKLPFLYKGQIKMSNYTAHGFEKTIWYMNAPIFVGECLVFHGKPSRNKIIATETCEIYFLEENVLYSLAATNPEILKIIHKILAQKIRVLTSQIEDLCVNEPTFRVAKLLYMLAKQNGERIGNDKYVVYFRLTHQGIADIAGLHRVTVTNILNKFCSKGIIKKDKEKIVILEIEELLDFFSNPTLTG